ncbi:MAG TPA: T9SS type B sorting domain-containing protein [Flavitalea sp.]|nr:T9SS type B sorting domain-containing protein [Flavitalea sp.]
MKRFFSLVLLIFLSQWLAAQDCDGISGNISPSTATFCEGGSTILTATGGSSYEWRLNDVPIAGETSSTITVTQEGIYSVIIIEGDCNVPASNTATVTVNPNPSGTISPANEAICPGGSTVLTATGGSSYTWFLDGVEITGETSGTLTVTQPGTYTATIHQGDCSAAASNNSVITQATTPTGTISPASASICQGSSVTLTATGGSSYTWFRNGNEINGQTGATLNVSQPGTYSVTIHQGNCSADASNTADITKGGEPTGTISPETGSICAGSSIVLTATGGNSYTWFLNGTKIAGQTGSTLTVTQAGTYSATIHQGDCSGDASNTSVITSASSPTGTISPANASICQGNSVTLTATGGSSYTWFLNGNQINGQTNATLDVTQAGTYTVTIHQGNCSGNASNSSVVTVASAPTGTISPATASLCTGGSQVLTVTGGDSYTWFLNGNEIHGKTGATLTATQAGTYTATIHQGNCEGTASNSSVVSVGAVPSGNISPANGTICQGGSMVLTATGGSTYTWFLNGNQINGQTGSTITVSQAGTYTAAIHQGNCSGDAGNNSVITVAAAPTGAISPANSSICSGSTQVLTVTGGTSYTWLRDGVEITGETGSTITVNQTGSYSAIIHQGDCNGAASNTAVVSIATLPSGTISPSTGSICPGGSLLLTATGGTSYSWFLNGVELAGQTTATLNATQPGIYFVIIRQGTCSGPAINTSVISLASAPTGTISPETGSVCEGGSLMLTATGGTSYIWSRDGAVINGETAATLNVTQPGTYSVTIQNGNCSGPALNTSVIATETIAGTRYPDINARPDVPVQLTARDIGVAYLWTPSTGVSNPASPSPTVTTSTDREYKVQITTESGCMLSDSVLVKVKTVIFVPTAFSPDGNGMNDILRPLGEMGSLEYFKVFNRWGQLIFETKDKGAGWNGKFKNVDQPSDTYTWFMAGTGKDGKPLKNSGKTFLIR